MAKTTPEYGRAYYLKNKERILANNEKYRLANKDKFKKYQKDYESRYPERVRDSRLKWVLNNKDKHKLWAINNRDKSRLIKKNWKLRNPRVKLENTLRTRILQALKHQGLKKNKRTIELVGCPIEELKKHLEKNFQKGMTWENRGYWGWHIDHIKPVSLFDLRDIEQQKKAFHYTNLQPLWMKDNFSKKNKYA